MSTTGPSRNCRGSPREIFWRNDPSCPGLSRASTSPLQVLPKTWMAGTSPAMTRTRELLRQPQPHIDLALDKGPFLRRAQHGDQLLELRGMLRRIFEPGDEIEGLAEIAAVIELARHLRQIFQGA